MAIFRACSLVRCIDVEERRSVLYFIKANDLRRSGVEGMAASAAAAAAASCCGCRLVATFDRGVGADSLLLALTRLLEGDGERLVNLMILNTVDDDDMGVFNGRSM